MKHLSYGLLLIAHLILITRCIDRRDYFLNENDDTNTTTFLMSTLIGNTYASYPTCYHSQVDRCSSPPCLNICFLYLGNSWRLDATGDFSAVEDGNSGQSPGSVRIFPRYLELSPDASTALGSGTVLFQAATHDGQPETTTGATILDNLTGTFPNEVAFSYSLASIASNTYEYMRVGIAYFQGRINMRHDTGTSVLDMGGEIGAFTGTRVQATTITINDTTVDLSTNVDQGFWVYKGDNLAKIDGTATTVTAVNPIADTSAVPSGSDVITGGISGNLDLESTHGDDINVLVILSTDKSFEWVDSTADGYWGGSGSETVADFGFRSLRTITY